MRGCRAATYADGHRDGSHERRRPVRADPCDLVGPRPVEDELGDERCGEQHAPAQQQRREGERREDRDEKQQLVQRTVDVQGIAGHARMRVHEVLVDHERDPVHDGERDDGDTDAAVPPQRARRAEPREEQRLVLLETEQQLRDEQRRQQRTALHGKRAARREQRHEEVLEEVSVREALRRRREQVRDRDRRRRTRARAARARECADRQRRGGDRQHLHGEQRLRVGKRGHQRHEREQRPGVVHLKVRAVLRCVPRAAPVRFAGEPLHEVAGVGTVAQRVELVQVERDIHDREDRGGDDDGARRLHARAAAASRTDATVSSTIARSRAMKRSGRNVSAWARSCDGA